MNIRNTFLALICVFLFLACESKNVQLKEEVIAIHDEVMPHMGKLQSLQKDLIQRAAQLESEDSLGQADHIHVLRNTAAELDLAYEGMFVWMRQFEPDQGNMTEDEFYNYLQEQKGLVEQVKQDINGSLEKAENLN
jgi:hypothetical protein